MKTIILLGLTALAATPLAAQTQTRSFDGPDYSGTRTVTRDKDAGTLVRDVEATRKSDGAKATRHYERQRTESGYTASGTATGFDGKSYSFAGQGERTADGYQRSQVVKDGSGATVLNRQVHATRADGQVHRNVTVDRAQGFRPKRAWGARRPR